MTASQKCWGGTWGPGTQQLGFYTVPFQENPLVGNVSTSTGSLKSVFPLLSLKSMYVSSPLLPPPPPRVTPVIHEFGGNPPISAAMMAFPCRHPDISVAG